MKKSNKQRSVIIIKRFFNILKTDLHRAFLSTGFISGVVFSFLILLYGSTQQSIGYSSVAFSFVSIFCFGNVSSLLFFSATFAYSASFAADWEDNFYRPVLSRIGFSGYAASKCVATALSSGTSVALGTLFFIIYLYIVEPTVMPEASAIYVEFPAFHSILAANKPVLFFAVYLYIAFLQAMFFGTLGLCVSAYFPNRYTAYAAPIVLGYTMNQIANFFNLPNWLNPMQLATGRVFNIPTWELLLLETVAFPLLTAVCFVLFKRTAKRRIANA